MIMLVAMNTSRHATDGRHEGQETESPVERDCSVVDGNANAFEGLLPVPVHSLQLSNFKFATQVHTIEELQLALASSLARSLASLGLSS